jgi:predicted YcjX-like family ATPase
MADKCDHIPEECTDVVVLLLTQIVKTAWWEMDVARVAADSLCGLTDVVLLRSVPVQCLQNITAD